MMGIKPPGPPSGPSPPGKFPDGDEGWDYDETAAPGIVPEPHFIQSTYIYRSPNVQEKTFSSRVVKVLKDIREGLAKSARLTLENENIECSSPTDHYRCQEYPATGTWNYLIVEDQQKGAATYTFDRKYNEKNDGTIEMALLDAFSRHSPSSLIAFASAEAEKEVGYIRSLTVQELDSLSGKTRSHSISLERYGPNELNLLEPALLEVRTGANLKLTSDSLRRIDSSKEFDKLLEEYKNVFILFWNSNRMVSLHTFNLWSRAADKIKISDDTLLAHVPCHDNSDFCQGLNAEDYHTVVSYKNGQNTGKTENIGDEEFYEQWIELSLMGSFQKLADESKLSEFKKGIVNGKKRSSVTIGVFPSDQDTSFQHFQIAAEKLAGKYYTAYFINENSKPAITTYRHAEKQKRTDYSGKFDPVTLMEFITKSSIPSIIDISHGFTTDVLFHQKRPILILFDKEFEPFSKLSSRQDARKSYIFTKVNGENEMIQKTKKALGIEGNEPMIVLLNKDRVHLIPTSKPKCPDHLQKLLQMIITSEAIKVLSTKDPHPLRYLQVQKVNEIFGFEETIVLPDHTLFLDSDPFSRHPPIPEGGGTGGCPFMQGGGAGGAIGGGEGGHHSEL
ncbi:hypothetical protein CAEBREN_16550 [Caenorhabditis brenneri]|uniref:Uncharacterized protein n=1 Tax=Caenorhabditis brenneri TaxID=135651 RepID=G0ME04_CAEBE|nr:hypothetical protein CAEBREN_16550 [Caenorhabditis brenneri]